MKSCFFINSQNVFLTWLHLLTGLVWKRKDWGHVTIIFVILRKLWRRCLAPAYSEDKNQVTFLERKLRVIESLRKSQCNELRSWCMPLLKHKNWELLYVLSAEILKKGIICRSRSGRGELTNIWSQVFLITRNAKPTSGWSRYSGVNGITIDRDYY